MPLFMFQHLTAAYIKYDVNIDDFTDEIESYVLLVLDDSTDGGVTFSCFGMSTTINFIPGIKLDRGEHIVRIRFGTDESFTKKSKSINGAAFSQDKEFIRTFLEELKKENDFIVKVGSERTQRFTNLYGTKAKIEKYLSVAVNNEQFNCL